MTVLGNNPSAPGSTCFNVEAQRKVRARTVTFFVFESPSDGEDGNVVGAGELGPIVIIDFYHNRSWHVFDGILTLVPDDILPCLHRPVHQAILNPDIVCQHDPRPKQMQSWGSNPSASS